MSRRTIFTVIVGVALLARLVHLASIWNHPYYEMVGAWPNSDMYQYQKWAEHLAAGDWLDRETFRPYFDWQKLIAPQEVWNSWYGSHTYYQPPLYPYIIAVVLRATGSMDVFRVVQTMSGAVNCGLIGLLGATLFSTPVGWVAGLGAAVYAPFIMYDSEVLRGSIGLTLKLLVLLGLARWYRTEAGRLRRRRALVTGGVLGAAFLIDSAVVLFPPLVFAWMAWSEKLRTPGSRPATWLQQPVLFVAGMVLALVPLMSRNLLLGAPLMSSTTRGPLAFVMGNAPDTQPAGAIIPPTTRLILNNSGYTMLGTMRETLKLYEGNYAPLFVMQLIKLRGMWGAYEIPDNPNFYYVTHVSPVVRWGLRFLPVAALGLVGMALSLGRAGREPLHALLPLYLISLMTVFMLAHIVSRYRQPLLIVLLPLAGYAIDWARTRGPKAWGGVAAGTAAALLLLPWSPPEGYGYNRPAEYIVAARMWSADGEPDLAVEELDDALGLVREEPEYHKTIPLLYYEKGVVQADAGRHEDAIDSFRAALIENPQLEAAAEKLAVSEEALRNP